ncbi:MAG: hypothetical protein GF347_00820 [Candidatus Moranbacteria bacterium]|nr:hypothetical protein [Candidatus Moranbacteria bacterium]
MNFIITLIIFNLALLTLKTILVKLIENHTKQDSEKPDYNRIFNLLLLVIIVPSILLAFSYLGYVREDKKQKLEQIKKICREREITRYQVKDTKDYINEQHLNIESQLEGCQDFELTNYTKVDFTDYINAKLNQLGFKEKESDQEVAKKKGGYIEGILLFEDGSKRRINYRYQRTKGELTLYWVDLRKTDNEFEKFDLVDFFYTKDNFEIPYYEGSQLCQNLDRIQQSDLKDKYNEVSSKWKAGEPSSNLSANRDTHTIHIVDYVKQDCQDGKGEQTWYKVKYRITYEDESYGWVERWFSEKNLKSQNKVWIKYEDIKVGEGQYPQKNDELMLFIRKKLVDGKEVANNYNSSYLLSDNDNLVAGLKIGTMSMQKGGIRKITIPPELGFKGDHKFKDSWLEYEVELKDIVTRKQKINQEYFSNEDFSLNIDCYYKDQENNKQRCLFITNGETIQYVIEIIPEQHYNDLSLISYFSNDCFSEKNSKQEACFVKQPLDFQMTINKNKQDLEDKVFYINNDEGLLFEIGEVNSGDSIVVEYSLVLKSNLQESRIKNHTSLREEGVSLNTNPVVFEFVLDN